MSPATANHAMQTLPDTRQKGSAPTLAGALRQPSSKQSLVKAFRSFANAAGSLESSYSQLQAEVGRLRRELERTNQDLNQSLANNRRIRAYLGRTLECLPCGVLVLDRDHKLKLANPIALELLGAWASQEERQISISKEVLEKLEAISGLPSASAEREWLLDTKDGQRCMAVSRTTLSSESSPESEWIFILRDITESKRLEKERDVARRTQDLAQMAMLLAHEIRNPLGSLELFAGLLAEGTEDRPILHDWVEQVRAGLRALSATVNNVLQFHSEPRSDLTAVNVVNLLRETVEFLQPLAWQREMRIDFSVGEPEILLLADAHRLQQVFINLALNAFRAMSAGGALHVSADCGSQAEDLPVRVVFRDEGVGIPSQQLDSVFDAGFTTHPGSPGLGLALTKKVVEQHRGKIRVESVPGRGTTFILGFPRSGAKDESGTRCR